MRSYWQELNFTFVLILQILIYLSFRNVSHKEALIEKALPHLYQLLGNNLNSNQEEISENYSFCLEKDIALFLHPDMIYHDLYLFTSQNDYAEIHDLVDKYGFPYIQIYGLKYTGQEFEPNWDKIYTCLFERTMRAPLQIPTYKESVLNLAQNKFLKQLTQENASKECLNLAAVAQKGYTDKNECQEIIKLIKQGDLKGQHFPKYIIRKEKGDQNEVGFLFEVDAQKLLDQFQDGKACGYSDLGQNLQIQEHIQNPLLFDGCVFAFRVYVVVASFNPLIVYIHQETSILVAAEPWSTHSFTQKSNFHDFKFVLEHLKSLGQDDDDDEGISFLNNHHLIKTYEGLTDYFIRIGVIPESTTDRDFLIQKIEAKLAIYYNHIADFHKDSRFSEFVAMDFVMDTNFNIHLMEIQNLPDVKSRFYGQKRFFNQVHSDNIKLLTEYLRDRYYRIRKFLNRHLLPYISSKQDKISRLPESIEKRFEETLKDEVYKNATSLYHYHLMDFKKGLQVCQQFIKQ